jgi:hypothetical protein
VRENQDLPRPGAAHHARSDMHGQAAHVLPDHLALPGMKPGANVQPEPPYRIPDRTGTPKAPRGPIEGGEEAIAKRLHLPADLQVAPIRSYCATLQVNTSP